MSKNNIVSLRATDGNPLQDGLREGARRLLAQAIDAEVDELLDQHTTRCTPGGRSGVV